MKRVFVINNEFMGHGDNALGTTLMGVFLKKVWARESKPDAMIFYNSAVKMLAKGSVYLDALSGLEESGVDLIACGTCIKFYGLSDSMVVGRISGMEEVVDVMQRAESTITI